MKHHIIQLSILLSALSLLISCEEKPSFTEKDLSPYWDTVQVLENPHKGWYHHYYDNGIDKYLISSDSIFYSFPGMDHLYLRLAWSFLEPEEGQFNWTLIDTIIDKYVAKGYGISFRITSKETGVYPRVVGQEKDGVQYAMPIWVQEAGAKGAVITRSGTSSWLPYWGDEVYLRKLDNFHKAFADRYDRKPWIRYVDVGSIGDWGEGHTFFSSRKEASNEEIKDVIDIHLKHYRHTQIIVSDDILKYGKSHDEIEELYDYATSNGLSLRDDSPMVEYFIKEYLATGSISDPQFYDPLYLTKPTILELQHYPSIKRNGSWLGRNGSGIIPAYNMSGAQIFRNAIKYMHATYIGFHGSAEAWLSENPELTGELLNYCGYWYFPQKAILPTMARDEMVVSIDWLNRGVAPAYHVYGIVFMFTAKDESREYEIRVDNSGNNKWLPGQSANEQYKLDISEIEAGSYLVKCKLVDLQSADDMEIKTGISQSKLDAGNFITLGQVEVD